MMQFLRFPYQKIKHMLLVFFSLFLTFLILTKPTVCLDYSLSGLQLWFNRMVPALFPFMVLSGMMVRLGLTDTFVSLLKPFSCPVFRVSSSCTYGMVIGFLCGFPMGAYTAAQLYENGQIKKEEASFLLAFCNNIGPVYFLSFVLPTLELSAPGYFLLGMYGLPFLYGLILRHTVFRNKLSFQNKSASVKSHPSFLEALDDSVFSSLSGIARLGGYMIFFNLLFIIPKIVCQNLQLQDAFCCLLEITGGIGLVQNRAPLLVLCILPFGGLSCIAQTFSMIKSTDLSLTEYIMHKMILTAITVCYYTLSGGKYFG